MFSRYLELLRLPGALNFSIFGLFGRFPTSMMGISTILMVRLLYGNYTLAGIISATTTIAYAVGALGLAKLVDRFGQARVMLPSITVSLAAMVATVVCALMLVPPVVVGVLMAVAGATSGSIGALARTRWPRLVPSPLQIQTAYALEAAIDEFCFVVGPVLATIAATAVHPVGGLVLLIVFFAVGGYGFLAQRATEPEPIRRVARSAAARATADEAGSAGATTKARRREIVAAAAASSPAGDGVSAQSHPKVRVFTPLLAMLAVTYMGAGLVFGVNDISVVAFADEQGYTSLSGVLLAVMSAGSLVAALVYGARNWRIPMWERFIIGVVLLAVGVTTFFFATNMVIMAVVLLLTGLTLAPTMTNVNTIIEMVTPKEYLTESLTWMSTAMCVGISLGSALAGGPVDSHGSHAGFLLVIGAGWLMVLLALVGLRLVKRETVRASERRHEHVEAATR